MKICTLVFCFLAALPLFGAEPADSKLWLEYWRLRALNAEAAYNNCASQTAIQRSQAEQSLKFLQESQSVGSAIDKACTDRGGKPGKDMQTGAPTCEEKKAEEKKKPEAKKPEAKKADANGKPAN